MTANGWIQIAFYLLVIFLVTKPLGIYMARVFKGEDVSRSGHAAAEEPIYRLTGVDEKPEMRWTEYAVAMLFFSVVSMMLLYAMQRLQYWLPWNPAETRGSRTRIGI